MKCLELGRLPSHPVVHLCTRRRRFAGAEDCSRQLEFSLKPRREWVRASERAPRNSQRILERLHALAELVEGGGGVLVERFQEAKALFRRTIPVARRVLGENDILLFRMKKLYAEALYSDTGATLDDHREAVTTLEETARTARRVLGGAHPMIDEVESKLRDARAALRAREAAESV